MKTMKTAFTLVELLVVIAIIALLLSVLMPSLGKVREQARFVMCGTSLHQIGLAEATYANENNGRLTPGDNWNGQVIYIGSSYGWPGAVNLGHLVAGKYVPIPKTKGEVLGCPNAKSALGGVYNKVRWGSPAASIWSAYDYRDSMSGGVYTGAYLDCVLKGLYKGVPIERMSKNVYVRDFDYHKRKYNLLYGGGNIGVLDDRKSKPGLRTGGLTGMGFTNWYNINMVPGGAPLPCDDVWFDAIDYLLGNPWYKVPQVTGNPAATIPPWRK